MTALKKRHRYKKGDPVFYNGKRTVITGLRWRTNGEPVYQVTGLVREDDLIPR